MPRKSYKKGLTFGAFDMFHIGHLKLIMQILPICDELIIFVSSDEYIKKHKGKNPVIPLQHRLRIVNAIRGVDDVGVQDLDYGKKEAIEEHKPDVLFVGDDWTPETYSGEGLGVPVEYLTHTEGISSTILRKRILDGLK